jgi:hypothetical protein
MNINQIIKQLGGQSALANLLGIRQSAIAYWVKKGSVPNKWHEKLINVAQQHGVVLTLADFTDQEIPMKPIVDNGSESLYLSSLYNNSVSNIALTPSQFIFYTSIQGTVRVKVFLGDETIWTTQQGMAEIFDTTKQTISYHLNNIFKELELEKMATVKEILTVQTEGNRSIERQLEYYNLDAIISVGYRVNSYNATQFRRWATSVLREYLIKGFALDDERLKQGKQLFGEDYFAELLERIREIRASERRFYQKITDIYSQCSVDYDKHSPITQNFYAHIQDKLHFAIHGQTAAELINTRADANKPHMGLTSWKNEKNGGKITKMDVLVGKNYLSEEELSELNRLVSMYLDWAENFARRKIALRMHDWAEKLDGFLNFNAYEVLSNYGKVKRANADKKAIQEFEKFRVQQDIDYESDFDKFINELQSAQRLPKM